MQILDVLALATGFLGVMFLFIHYIKSARHATKEKHGGVSVAGSVGDINVQMVAAAAVACLVPVLMHLAGLGTSLNNRRISVQQVLQYQEEANQAVLKATSSCIQGEI